jgi:hypothetical protein
MRYYNQGAGFRVSYNRNDADEFSSRWPCSTVEGAGWFEYANGDLVDRGADTRRHENADGPDWLAFSQDCQAYGEARHKKVR